MPRRDAGLLYVIDLRIYETLQPQHGRRPDPLHAEHRHRPGAGRGDQGPDARAHPRRRRRQRAEDLQPAGLDHAVRLGLRPPGGQGLGHRLRHLDRSRLSMAHRHRRHADDDVPEPVGGQSGPQTARAAVELPHPLRRRVAPASGTQPRRRRRSRRPAVPRADRSLRRRTRVLRRRSDRPRCERLGLTESDFTVDEPWDQYPIVGQLLAIWDATGRYVRHLRRSRLPDRRGRAARPGAPATGSRSPSSVDGGNLRGLPAMDSKEALKRVLHSLIYRITAHGTRRLYRSANPALTFVANFPPCLQDATIPDPTDSFDTQALHRFLPRTGTIGSMVHFYFIFHFSPPYVPFVPIGGPETELFFDDEVSNQALDRAAPLRRRLHRDASSRTRPRSGSGSATSRRSHRNSCATPLRSRPSIHTSTSCWRRSSTSGRRRAVSRRRPRAPGGPSAARTRSRSAWSRQRSRSWATCRRRTRRASMPSRAATAP